MPFGFNSVQTHVDILNVLAKAQALNTEVVVSSGDRVAVEGCWGRFLRKLLSLPNITGFTQSPQVRIAPADHIHRRAFDCCRKSLGSRLCIWKSG